MRCWPLLAWFTLGSTGFYVGDRAAEMRTAVCIFLGGLTLKTLIPYKAGWWLFPIPFRCSALKREFRIEPP
jgi:hypothetical protein